LTVQPVVGVVPESVTVKPSWKPPLHELVTDQVAVQPPAVAELLAEALTDGDDDALALAEALADALADADAERDGVAETEAEADPDGAVPLPLVSTTTDSAGTDSELPENALVVTVGLAAL
jgi:hypothetical protein